MPILYYSHSSCLLHEMGQEHPESPARLEAINDQLISAGLDALLVHREAPRASREQLVRVHDAAYVDSIFSRAPAKGSLMLDADTLMNPHSLEAALHAAGALVAAVDEVMTGPYTKAFCGVRPPGHHAEPGRALGFCIFNNIAVGAAQALTQHGLERIAICDFDVHHGNGTQAMFAHEPRVLFCSSFQHPYYPYPRDIKGHERLVMTPLAAGCTSLGFRQAIEDQWLPALDAFRPQLLMISAGFDAHAEDEMAGLLLKEDDYRWVTAELKAVADRHAQGRMVSTLEGGYALSALGRSLVAHLKAMF